ncbi:50S ribosomal protein L2 [Candidatus Wolfebacteria bacterium CG_4_10_14_0_2_um_filter_39_18]|uniref:Large ribosomal subunit protein uL2 n=1 Tax=Candidatus Wolfebacteria bacterium CG_4_10_14_0_2_um_filter_39_18 TaxID=1975061 RepID=A0A2M7TGZ2_9BACT|nr:MAG: 50S ribosomal protein L2 [Candidatus Wolfebacteria bacterium CG_4_10_14_0_2_um_filter_39_18]
MKKYKPTTPSRRFMTTVDYGVLSGAKPIKKLLKKLKVNAGRNNQGRITVRHQGGGVKKLYRTIDFKQNKIDIPAKIEGLEYDPNRTSFIARILYKDGERRYILASKNMKTGDELIASENAPLKEGNRLKLKNIPVGYLVFNVEIDRNKGGQMARSAGSYAEILAQENGYTNLKLSSGEVRKVSWENFGSLGQTSNSDHNLTVIGKAGRSRMMGIRPTVRGSAMNPVDHPYGGGEGRGPRGTKRPKTLWGKITGGSRTRKKKKWSNKMIIKRRNKNKR